MIGITSCQKNQENQVFNSDNNNVVHRSANRASTEEKLLDNTFRIDLKTISVTFDYFPNDSLAEGQAKVIFNMRPDQTRPLIHFDPAIHSNAPDYISLNGEVLDFSDSSDVRIIDFVGSTQQALEFQRNLQQGIDHTLEISYRLNLPQGYPRFSPDVHDIEGRGNEEIFPTINSPQDMARHKITFRVHGNTMYHCIGSGLVEEVLYQGIQEWHLDTEREIASQTLFFVLMPANDVLVEQRRVNGVDVRIMEFIGGGSTNEAFHILESWLPELEANLGPFPMPRGLSIFLTSFSGGMEFYGGTITSLRALEHEVFHMYFGCSTIGKTYRDLWWDEAINMWYEYSVNPEYPAIYPDYMSNIVSGRSPIAVGCDYRAYDEGARIFQAVAERIGGRQSFIGFLKYLHKNYSFIPFNTMDLVEYLRDYSGVDMTSQFINWVYDGNPSTYDTQSILLNPSIKKVDLTPPQEILKKYEKSRRLK
jgi:hypothetical protein